VHALEVGVKELGAEARHQSHLGLRKLAAQRHLAESRAIFLHSLTHTADGDV